MKKSGRTVAVVFGGGILAACAAGSDIPKTAAFGSRYAEATYLKGYKNSGLGNASNQFYTKAYDDTCDSLRSGARFAPLSGSSKTVLLEANRRTIIYALTNNLQSGGVSVDVVINQSTCLNKVVFTPQPNTRYQIVQRRENAGSCYLEITDVSTGDVPGDVEQLPAVECIKAQ